MSTYVVHTNSRPASRNQFLRKDSEHYIAWTLAATNSKKKKKKSFITHASRSILKKLADFHPCHDGLGTNNSSLNVPANFQQKNSLLTNKLKMYICTQEIWKHCFGFYFIFNLISQINITFNKRSQWSIATFLFTIPTTNVVSFKYFF